VKRNDRNGTTREAIRIRSVADLHGAIEYFETTYGVGDAELIFPDCLPVVSAEFIRTAGEDGREASRLILSDEWPRGMRRSARYELYRVTEDEA
jgi:hypothetical protein